ncbi:MAG: S16 family serine protease [Fusobacteriaceae bacterium]
MLPDANIPDADEIPAEIKKDMKIHFVKDYREVEEIVLEKIEG